MRIAHFTESYRPVINGAAIAVHTLARTLGARHGVEVFAPQFPGYRDEAGLAHRVHRFPSWIWPPQPRYPLAIPASAELGRHFAGAAFDVVHTHSPFALGQTGRRWARRHGIPVVTTYHTLYVEYAHYAQVLPAGVVRRYLQQLSRAYCNAVDAVVVPTDPIREVLRGYGVSTPIEVIPTGLDLRPPVPPCAEFPRGRFGIPPEVPLVLYAGRLVKEKNLPLLFQAFTRVRATPSAPEPWLLVCGSGPLEAAAQTWARESGAGDRVRFAGFVEPDRMGEVYAACDVFAFTSLTDTQGLVVTEAKAAGLPTVSVNAYGPGALIRHEVDGLLTPNDPEAFAGALQRLLYEPGMKKRLAAAALEDAGRYSIEATARAYEALYQSVIRGG